MIWTPKLPADIKSYKIDWSRDVGDDPIETFEIAVTSGTVAIDDSDNDATTATALISGGVAAETATFAASVTTVGGQVFNRAISLLITDDAALSTTRKRVVIEMAVEECKLAGYEFNFSPEEYVATLRRLDTLASGLKADGIDLGYNFPATMGGGEVDDASGIADADLGEVAVLLSFRLAPMIGKTMSAESKIARAEAQRSLRARYAVIPTTSLPGGTPLGAGNRRATFRRFSPVVS